MPAGWHADTHGETRLHRACCADRKSALSVSPRPTRRPFFFNDTATTEIYTLSLHDALPIYLPGNRPLARASLGNLADGKQHRSEEHTSELQSPCNLVCRLLLEKKYGAIRCADRIRLPRAAERCARWGLCL